MCAVWSDISANYPIPCLEELRIQTGGFCCRNWSSAKGIASAGHDHSQLFDCLNSFLEPSKAVLNAIHVLLCNIRLGLGLSPKNATGPRMLTIMSASDPKTTMPTTQANLPQSVPRLTLAIIVTTGWLVLLCLNFRRRRKTDS